MNTEQHQSFVKALRDLDGSVLLSVLPQIAVQDLKGICQDWLSGKLVGIDPTNVLCGGDYADQFLNLSAPAIVMYDAALEYMHRHPDSIADDTDCAAASLTHSRLRSSNSRRAYACETAGAECAARRGGVQGR
jgi:hypothetical protein